MLTYLYSLHHTLVSSLHQLSAVIVNLTNKECLVQITVETTMVDCNIHYRGKELNKFSLQ